MDKNKSIDGLRPRRIKTTATKKPTPKPITKTIAKPKAKPKTTTVAKTSPKSPKIAQPKTTTTQPRNNTPNTATVEDFLSPVQAFNFDEDNGKLEAAIKTNPNPKTKPNKEKKMKIKKEKKKTSKTRRIITWMALIIVFILIGLVTWAVLWGNDIIAKITGGQGNVFNLFTFIEPTFGPLKTDENGRTNILAFGTSGYNMEGDEGDGIHDGAQLTDSIMLISLNQETGDLAMLSLPRDLKASPTCTATSKINEVYWCNNMQGDNEQAGAEALMTEVGSILGVDFQYYTHINWGSLIQIVDSIGGITVVLDETVYGYYDTYEAGVEYTLNGEDALILSRERYGTTRGDFSRSANQQKILIGIKNKLVEKNLNIADYISLASALGDNLRTNFSIEEIKTLAHLISKFDLAQMRQLSLIEPEQLLSTGNINNISYVLPAAGVGNYGKIQTYTTKMLNNDPRTYEEPTILVLNGTNTAFLASNEADKLQEKGYVEVAADNAPEGEYREDIALYSTTSEKSGTKKMLEELYETEAKTDLPENLPQNYDFIIILGGEENSKENN